MQRIYKLITIALILSFQFMLLSEIVQAEEGNLAKLKPDGMNNVKLGTLIQRLDKEAKGKQGYWEFKIDKQVVYVITDERADRMRILVAITESELLSQQALYRLMQANFDTALDARYSIAKGVLWSAYIHPLSALTDKQFLIGVGQTVNLANSFGSSYSSGALIFQGGDSKDLQKRQLIDDLLERGLTT